VSKMNRLLGLRAWKAFGDGCCKRGRKEVLAEKRRYAVREGALAWRHHVLEISI
jgi:hypothetical protein